MHQANFCFIKIFPSHTVPELVDSISEELLSYAVAGSLLTRPGDELISQPPFGNISEIRTRFPENNTEEQISQGRTINFSSGYLINVVVSFPTTFRCHKPPSRQLWSRYSATYKHPLILPVSLCDTK